MEQQRETNSKTFKESIEKYESLRNKFTLQNLNDFQENILTTIQSIFNDTTQTFNNYKLLELEKSRDTQSYIKLLLDKKEQIKSECLVYANTVFKEDLKIDIEWRNFDYDIAYSYYDIKYSSGGGLGQDRDWNWGQGLEKVLKGDFTILTNNKLKENSRNIITIKIFIVMRDLNLLRNYLNFQLNR